MLKSANYKIEKVGDPQGEALADLASFLDANEPTLARNIKKFWRERAKALPVEATATLIAGGMATAELQTVVRRDTVDLLQTVIRPFWEKAYLDGSLDTLLPNTWVEDRIRFLERRLYNERLRALEDASRVLRNHTDPDPDMVAEVYGLPRGEAVAVARYEVSLINKSLRRSALDYVSRLLTGSSLAMASYELAGAYNAARAKMYSLASGAKIIGDLELEWVTQRDGRVCFRCLPLDGEIVYEGAVFSAGVYRPPLHPACRCSSVRRNAQETPGVGRRGKIIEPREVRAKIELSPQDYVDMAGSWAVTAAILLLI